MSSSPIDDIERRLQALADEPPPESWKAEAAGDQITGKLRRVEDNATSYGPCQIAVLESLRTPGRLASVWLFHTTLHNQFKKANPQPGENVLVRYEGKVEREGQQPYHLWKVVVDRDDASTIVDWGDQDEPAGADGVQGTPPQAQPVAQNGPAGAYSEPDIEQPPPADGDEFGDIPF